MEFVQPLSSETETTLLHIPPQCSQQDLDDFFTWVGDRGQSVEFRSRLGLTDGVVDKLNLQCSTWNKKTDMTSYMKSYMISYMI